MTKRIKRVFSSPDQVLHLWANQSQDNARSRNVYFEGDTCFSYGSHYPLGKLVQWKGKTVALINSRGYSVTTSGHISSARSAVSHLIVIDCPTHERYSFSLTAEEYINTGLKLERETLLAEFEGLLRRRSFHYKTFSQMYLSSNIQEFNVKCTALKLSKYKIKLSKKQINEVNDHIKARLKREAELKALRADPEYQNELDAKREAKLAREIPNWRKGGTLTKHVRSQRPMLLRIKGDTVQTSGGAEVPLSHALRLLKLVTNNEAKQGERIGHFALSSVSADSVKIGCHTIEISEAKEVLKGATTHLSLVS